MPWKALLEGHVFDLETLGAQFQSGDPLIAEDPSDGYYIESLRLQDVDGQLDHSAAEALIKRVNGVARATDQGFRPVHLTGRYTAPDGTSHVFAVAGTAEGRSKVSAIVTVLRNGIPIQAPPKGPRYVKLAEQDPDVADVLRVLGQADPLDWYDIYKAWEIVENAVGGWPQVVARGWATKVDIDRLTASANHPGISGDEARHARMPGTPGPNRMMAMSEGGALVRQLVANWIESHPSYLHPKSLAKPGLHLSRRLHVEASADRQGRHVLELSSRHADHLLGGHRTDQFLLFPWMRWFSAGGLDALQQADRTSAWQACVELSRAQVGTLRLSFLGAQPGLRCPMSRGSTLHVLHANPVPARHAGQSGSRSVEAWRGT